MTLALQDPALYRLLLVLSVGVAFAVYTRLHLVGGGSVSGGYLAILVVTADWSTLLGTVLVTAITVAIMRGALLRVLGIPRSWQFVLSVLVGALVTTGLAALVPTTISLGSPFLLSISFGAFVIPGMLAYDISHQGFPRTMLALALVGGATLAICVPTFLVLQGLPTATEAGIPLVRGIPESLLPYAVIAVILIGAALRFTFGLRSGGFIGALFIVEFFTASAFLAVGLASVTTHAILWLLDKRVVFTPRQQSMVALMLGALVAWAGLYWGSAVGWLPAQEANLYTLSPLLATGLIAADMGRPDSGVLRALLGTGIACVLLSAALWVTQSYGLLLGIGVLLVIAAALIPAVLALRQPWAAAERSGRERLIALGRVPAPPA